MSPRRKVAAVLFADLCDSVGLAARMDAEDYAALIGEARSRIERHVTPAGGTICQFYGDGALILFLAGPEVEDATLRAARAALGLEQALAGLTTEDGAPVRLHCGLHAGLVLVRDGDGRSGVVEAVGLPTAIAARLAAAAGPGEVLVSEATLGPARARFRTGPPRLVSIDRQQARVRAVTLLSLLEAAPATGMGPFVGREAEVALADDLFARIADGSPADQADGRTDGSANGPEAARALRFLAPPGQGKSRLARELSARARARGFLVLTGQSAEGGEPLQPFRQMARHLVSGHAAPELGAPETLAAVLSAYFPADGIAPLAVGGSSGNVDPEQLGRTVCDGLSALSSRRPVALLLDDWHWADSASLLLLKAILRAPGRILLLIFQRPPQAGDLPLEGVADRLLPPLADEDALALIRSRLPALDHVRAAQLQATAGGNPLYLEELCHLLQPGAGTAVPDASEAGWFAASVETRFRRLDAELQRLVALAAVAGQRLRLDLLAELAGRPVDRADIEALAGHDLLLPDDRPGGLRFKHGLTRDILYRLVPPEERRRLHGEIARSIEQRDPHAHEALALHHAQSGQHAKAAHHAEAAGKAAADAHAIDRARHHYLAALSALDRLPPALDTAMRWAQIMRRLAMVAVYDADPALIRLFAEARRRAGALGDQATSAQADYWLAYAETVCGRTRPGILHYQQALATVEEAGLEPLAAEFRASLGHALACAARYEEAEPLLTAAIHLRDKRGRPSLSVPPSLAYLGAILADRGEFAAARARFDEALALLPAPGHPVEATIRSWAAQAALWSGDPALALHHAEASRAVTMRTENAYMEALARHFAASARFLMAPSLSSLEAMAAADDCLHANGKELYASAFYARTAEAAARLGRIALARRSAARALWRTRQEDWLGAAMAWRVLAGLADTEARARRCLERAEAVARRRQSAHEAAANQQCAAEIDHRFGARPDAFGRAAAG